MAQILFYDLLRLSQFKLSYPTFSKKCNHANPYCTYLASRSMTCCLKFSTSCPNTKVDEQINNTNVVLENMIDLLTVRNQNSDCNLEQYSPAFYTFMQH